MKRLTTSLIAVLAIAVMVNIGWSQQNWPAESGTGPYAPGYPGAMPPWQQDPPTPLSGANRYDSGQFPQPFPPRTAAAPANGNYQPGLYQQPAYQPSPTQPPNATGPVHTAYGGPTQPGPPPSANFSASFGPASHPPADHSHAPANHQHPPGNNPYPPMQAPEEITAPDPEVDLVIEEELVPEIVVPAVKWEHSFELGLDGSEGNTETFNFRFGYDGLRETERHETDWSADYKFEENAGTTTVDEFHFEGQHDWLFEDSPWSIFVHSTYDFDQFTAYDSRVAADAGLGYRFWKTEISKLKGRFGSGASKEFGSVDDDWKPELSFALAYERQLTDRQKLKASCEYYPEIGDFTNSWIVTKVDWEILVDEAWNMSLKVGVRDRYDSTPSGAKHNDLDYSTVLLWNF